MASNSFKRIEPRYIKKKRDEKLSDKLEEKSVSSQEKTEIVDEYDIID